MDREKDKSKQLDRRSLLKGAGLALGAAGATAATAGQVAAAPANDGKPQQAGYSETDHVRTYYKHARF
ncbi:MAG: formate dehydrogenase [Pseudolabrys sp.]|nr:formate dehydrogenase [Pseudolabrys sp.]